MNIKTKELKKNAAVTILFQPPMDGYLYGDNVFIEVINNKAQNVYSTDNNLEDIEEALYLVEKEIDSLGLDLKNDTVFNKEDIKNKMISVFKTTISNVPFEILSEGEVIEVNIEPEVAVEEDTISENITESGPDANSNKKEVEEIHDIDNLEDIFPSSLFDLLDEQENNTAENNQAETKVDAKIEEEKEVEVSLEQTSEIQPEAVFETSSKTEATVETEVEDEAVVEVKETKVEPEIESTKPANSVPVEETIEEPTVEIEPKTENKETITTIASQPKQAEVYPIYFNDDEYVTNYLDSLSIPSGLKNWALSHRQVNRERLMNAPQFVVDEIQDNLDYLGDANVLIKSLSAMKADLPLSFKGPAGTGKTTIVQTISTILNLPLFSINGSLESNKSTLIGELDIKEKGLLTVKDGQMQKAAIYGGILYIDEINMMRPDILASINSFTDHRKTFYNDVRGETVKAHKFARFVSAMNIGYSGVKKMNEATMDRTVSIELKYMSKSELKKILTNILSHSEEGKDLTIVERETTVEKVAKIYTVLSQRATDGLVPDLAGSTRSIIQLLKLVPLIGYQLALEMILDKFEEEEAVDIKGALLENGLDQELGLDLTL